MDNKPFLMLDLLDIDDHAIPEIAKITKLIKRLVK
jgi:hypothetical protein